MSAIVSSTSTTYTSPLSPVERAALRVAEYAAIVGRPELTTAIVVELQAAGLLVTPVRRTAYVEYECPTCHVWAVWTRGESLLEGGQRDAHWCQSCGVTIALAVCTSQPIEVRQLRARVAELTELLEQAQRQARTSLLEGIEH